LSTARAGEDVKDVKDAAAEDVENAEDVEGKCCHVAA
jgi:hypothetical protein